MKIKCIRESNGLSKNNNVNKISISIHNLMENKISIEKKSNFACKKADETLILFVKKNQCEST